MPIYEYECPVCKTRTEVLQKMSDTAPNCPAEPDDADHGPMEKVMSTPSRAVFKGSGFYETDYKRRGK